MTFQDSYWTLYTRALCYWIVYDHVLVFEYGATFPFISYTVYNVYNVSCYYVQFLFDFYVCPYFVFIIIANESSLAITVLVLCCFCTI